MDAKLHIVQHLYGEGGDPSDLQRLLEDEAVQKDYQALSDVKQYLDQRPPARPDPEVIDRIVAVAAAPRAGVLPGRRQDRAARPGLRRYRLVGALSGVLALVLVVGIGLNEFVFRSGTMSTPDAAFRQEAPASVAPEASEEARADRRVGALAPEPQAPPQDQVAAVPPPAAEADELPAVEEEVAAAPPALPQPAATVGDAALAGAALRDAITEDEAAPTWDDADELLRVHRNIDMLRARSRELIWDESAVMSLDSLPAQPAEALPGLNAAGKKQ